MLSSTPKPLSGENSEAQPPSTPKSTSREKLVAKLSPTPEPTASTISKAVLASLPKPSPRESLEAELGPLVVVGPLELLCLPAQNSELETPNSGTRPLLPPAMSKLKPETGPPSSRPRRQLPWLLLGVPRARASRLP